MATTTGSSINFARIVMAINDEGTDMFRAILKDKIPSSDILMEANKVKKKLSLNATQKALLKRASTSDYSELDISLLYTLIRNISNIPEPTNDWGEMPDQNDFTIGGDIERIRTMRNEICGHPSDTQMSDADFQTHFNTIRDIGKRMDIYFSSMNKKTAFEKQLKEIETKIVDGGIVQQYINKIKDMEEREGVLEGIVRACALGGSRC